jgi:hypothetical protein
VTGSIIIKNFEIHDNKTIGEVRGLGPLFRESSPMSTDKTVYKWDVANHNESGGAYYMETNLPASSANWNSNIANSLLGYQAAQAFRSFFYIFTTNNIRSYDGVNNPSIIDTGYLKDTLLKLGQTYDATDAQMGLRSENVTWAETPYDGSFDATEINTGRSDAADASFKIRNVRRYDVTDYADGKTIIDGLMA